MSLQWDIIATSCYSRKSLLQGLSLQRDIVAGSPEPTIVAEGPHCRELLLQGTVVTRSRCCKGTSLRGVVVVRNYLCIKYRVNYTYEQPKFNTNHVVFRSVVNRMICIELSVN